MYGKQVLRRISWASNSFSYQINMGSHNSSFCGLPMFLLAYYLVSDSNTICNSLSHAIHRHQPRDLKLHMSPAST